MTEIDNTRRQSWLSVPRRQEEERLDPHVYKRGVNGLTVEEAVGRAYPRVVGILRRSGEEYSGFEGQLVRQTIRACLISQVSRAKLYRIGGVLAADRRGAGAPVGRAVRAGLSARVSRANLYRIAGILVADRRDEGAHLGRSLALTYIAALREAFLPDLSVGERVGSPSGPGEARYGSGDGHPAPAPPSLAARREACLPGLAVCERVGSPSGHGGVRYVSGDGHNAAVQLDGGH